MNQQSAEFASERTVPNLALSPTLRFAKKNKSDISGMSPYLKNEGEE